MATIKKQQVKGVGSSNCAESHRRSAACRCDKPMKTREEKQKAALASRAAARANKAKRRSVLALPAPMFDTLNDEGLISYPASMKDLEIIIDASDLVGEIVPGVDELHINMRGKGVTGWGAPLYRFILGNTGSPDISLPFTRILPVSRLTPGDHEVVWRLMEGGVIPTDSTIARLKVDREAPFGNVHPPAPILSDELIAAGKVTQQLIDDNPLGFMFSYVYDVANGRALDDEVAIYFSKYSSSQLSDPVDKVPVTDPLTITLPWADLDLEGGTNYLFMQFFDLAGNVSKDSRPVPVLVEVVGAPVPLEPAVDLALKPDDGLIDLGDAHHLDGVHVIIPAYANWQPTDFIEVRWGNQPSLRFPVGAQTFPLFLRIPGSVIFADYGSSTGEVSTIIQSYVDRGGNLTDAPEHVINVDVSAPGPLPGEDEENPLLVEAVTYGRDATNPNVLDPDDHGNDATVEVTLWTTPIPTPGIIVTVYWGSLAHPVGSVTLTTEGPGATLVFTVSWATIKEVGNGPIGVFYVLSWMNNNNSQKSLTQIVNVSANKTVLGAATFQKAGPRLGCNDLIPVSRGARVRVPGNSDVFRLGMRILLEWQIYREREGLTKLGDPIEFQSEPLTQDDIYNGFWYTIIPYETAIEPCARNSVDVHYYVDVPGEGLVKSERAFTETTMANLNDVPCHLLPPTGKK